MTIIYKCDTCGKEFNNSRECSICEISHMSPADRIKFMIMLDCGNICDYCEHSYYVYGCEQDCTYKDCRYFNAYKDFVPTEPLHDKHISGV